MKNIGDQLIKISLTDKKNVFDKFVKLFISENLYNSDR